MVRDTVNNFEIGVPEGWLYGVPQNKSVDFVALRQKTDTTDVPRENFNIFLLNKDEKDLTKSYKLFLESLRANSSSFKVKEEGEITLNNRNYKWLIETHKNKHSGENMHNYVLFTNNGGRILVLTMVTISDNFNTYKPLFEKIASSLKY
ncbi:hypothetical protein JAO76_10420 [Pontibacter sp. BT310]|uniref:DUF1795 domain-containing protein n=1 Tax=Pontibacter populi TaxID=890055 RepID=A0ABS6XC22_9BACT|nr:MULTISPECIES: hypothetical protein [Pontibacter]MBJ6118608.1 hypothetical protein [Pontibacter sp. BT310]MBR0571037.1 hypothetical protein [Microvirga sp. STS03]MBW3365462.1 hypothetical protein [Pontibacter populi]